MVETGEEMRVESLKLLKRFSPILPKASCVTLILVPEFNKLIGLLIP